MNILLSFLQDKSATPHNIPAYRFWLHYLRNGIEEAGMQYTEVPGADWAEGLLYQQGHPKLDRWKDVTWSATLDYIRLSAKKPDLFLCYLYPHQIDAGAIKQIQQAGIPCINFYCDNVRHFSKVPAGFKVFNYIWVPEYEAVTMYQRAKVNYLNLPMPMWIAPEFRTAFTPQDNPTVSFIGSKDELREQLLGSAINKGLDVVIRGSEWLSEAGAHQEMDKKTLFQTLMNQFKFVNEHGVNGLAIKMLRKANKQVSTTPPPHLLLPKPDFDQYISITRNSSITLGINRVPSFKSSLAYPLKYSRLRDIEAPMLGACYLTEYCAGIDHLYDTRNEIYTYNNAEELVEKCRELLQDPAKRKQLRINGQKKALNEWSIPLSLQKIKDALF